MGIHQTEHKVVLQRKETGDEGTFGTISVYGKTWFTGELPWRDNKPARSCVPRGTYLMVWGKSPRLHKFTYRLVDVPGRAGVLIHAANLVGDREMGYRCQLLGCIALGERLGVMGGQRAILLSQPAVRAFEALGAGRPLVLEIHDA